MVQKKLLDYSGLQRFLNKIKTLLDSKSNTGHTHVTSEVTDLLNSQHTWSAQQSYSADLNLNYANTDVDDILDTVAGSYTAEDFLAQNNVWTGDNTFTANVSLQGGIYAQNYYLGTTAFGDIVTHNASEFLTSHQSLSNYVTLNSTQTISGIKTITGGNQGKMVFKNPNYTKGDANESSVTVSRIYFGNSASYDSANAVLSTDINTSGNSIVELAAIDNTASSSTRTSLILTYDKSATRKRQLKSWGDFVPYGDSTYDLGSSSYQWSSVYAQSYYYNGTQWGLDKANVWTGENTFKATITYEGNLAFYWKRPNLTVGTLPSSTMYYGATRYGDSTGTTIALTRGIVDNSGKNHFRQYTYAFNDTSKYCYIGSGINADGSGSYFAFGAESVIPVDNNTTDLGSSTNQWKKIYSADVVHTSGDETITGVKTLIDYWRLQAKNLKAGEGETYGRTGYSFIYTDKNDVEMGDVTLFKNSGAARSYLRIRGGDYYTNGAPAAAGTLVQSDLRIGTLANGTRMIECYTDAFYPVDTNTTDLGTSANQWKSVYAQTYYYNGTAWGLDKANRFTACQTISGSNVGGENTTNYRTVMALQSNRDTDGKSCMYITKFRQNRAQGSMGADDLAQIAIDVLENEVRTNNLFCFGVRGFSSNAPSIAIFSSGATGSSNLGTSATPWTNIYGTTIYENGTALSSTYTKQERWAVGSVIFGYITKLTLKQAYNSTGPVFGSTFSGDHIFTLNFVIYSAGTEVKGDISGRQVSVGNWEWLGEQITYSSLGADGDKVCGMFRRKS